MTKLFTGFLVIILAVGVAGMWLPSEYKVTRGVDIEATPAQIHAWVGDLKRWPEWSPWESDDPTLKITTGARTTGIGASQTWSGESGDGRLVFAASSPATGVEYDLWFDNDAFQARAAILYAFAVGEVTHVTWTMEGTMGTPVLGGYYALLMDYMAGNMFDTGLGKLKQVVEQNR